MYNIEEVHCSAAINAILQANLQLMHATVEEALQPVIYGKKDTLGLDGIPESTISDTLRRFDRDAILITEEIGTTFLGSRPSHLASIKPTFYLSDPTDRSSHFKNFLREQENATLKVGDVINSDGMVEQWEKKCGAPASITGATSAITCVRYGIPINCAIVNFITQELFVALREGVFLFKLPHFSKLIPDKIKLEQIREEGELIFFRSFSTSGHSIERMHHFVTFMGKTGYRENFTDSDIISAGTANQFLDYDQPGGPTRVLYLSTLQPKDNPIGFILANGEKIGEWIHWIPFLRFGAMERGASGSKLRMYEIHHARPWTKDGILMATTPPYSIFQDDNEYDRKKIIDINKFQSFPNPSKIRATLLLAPSSNTWAITVMERHLFREIQFSDQI